MPKLIRFSADYKKLPKMSNGALAKLLSVEKVNLDDLRSISPNFILYDTAYRNKPGGYELFFTDALILVFIHIESGLPFTTIRRNTGKKYEYYAGMKGKIFKIRIGMMI